MKKTIMILGAGGGGGNNLIRSFRKSPLAGRIIGSNCFAHSAAKSTADRTYLLPESSKANYKSELLKVLDKEGVNLIVPNNDREVAAISAIREELPVRKFLPDDKDIQTCQNKNDFYRALENNNVPVPGFVLVTSEDDIADNMKQIDGADKYWVRPIRGSGSTGATWVTNASQAHKWISLWVELRGYKYTDFQVSRFLSGRDFNFQSIWKNGVLITFSMIERKSYFMGNNRLSGMSSTPEVAVTVKDDKVIETVLKVIRGVCNTPNGSINVDIKEDSEGNVFITEFNIGRFPMITTIHDSAASVSPASAYLSAAFDEDLSQIPVGDYRENIMLVRDLDTEPYVVESADMPNQIGGWS
jgi:carbamoyl-phosphate synthase large subunit